MERGAILKIKRTLASLKLIKIFSASQAEAVTKNGDSFTQGDDEMPNDNTVKSLHKAIAVLECFTTQEPELSITEISSKLGLYKSTVHNIVSTFEQHGYIERNPQTNKCHLGMKVLKLTHVFNVNHSLTNVIRPIIRDLANLVNENVYFAVPDGGEILYLEGAYPSSYLSRTMIGEKAEMYCTGLGKAILAFLPEEEQKKAILLQSLKSYTPTTITDRQMLVEEIARIRKRGYSIDNMEHEIGIKCVSVPVISRSGELLGAMSVSGPSLRFGEEAIPVFFSELSKSAKCISDQIP